MRIKQQHARYIVAISFLMASSLPAIAARSSKQHARVTQIIREVNLITRGAAMRRAVLNENVAEGTAVRTGSESRSELTFPDFTITRIGANTLYSFRRAGRNVQLSGGSTLLSVPKGSGGAKIYTPAVTAGVTGTTLIFEYGTSGQSRLTVLEGNAQLTLVRYPGETRAVKAGQMLDVAAGARKLSPPVEVDLDRLMKTSPLIVGFRPLPSRNLINAAIRQQRERGGGGPNQNGPRAPGAPGMSGPPSAAPPPGPGHP